MSIHARTVVAMKIIVAGYPLSGTKALKAALVQLGYTVPYYAEHLYRYREQWKKILQNGPCLEDFKTIYKNVDVIIDTPGFYFWEEIYSAFPEAKIILTQSEDEDKWIERTTRYIASNDSELMNQLCVMLSRSHRRAMLDVGYPMDRLIYGRERKTGLFSKNSTVNMSVLRTKYREYNAYIKKTASADKLLVYNCSEEWKPLCKFLGRPVPEIAFPKVKIRDTMLAEIYKWDKKVFRQVEDEFIRSLYALAALTILSGFLLLLWLIIY